MPTATPPSTPRPVEPTAQPVTAPPAAQAPTVPARIAPASAGANDEREAACIRGENSRVRGLACNTLTPHHDAIYDRLCDSTSAPRARQCRERRGHLGGTAAARGAVRARR